MNTKKASNLFVVEYSLPYEHLVRVGIKAKSAEAAIAKAQAAFEQATIWDDTAAMPLLTDSYEENGYPGHALTFTATQISVDGFPEADYSVQEIRRGDARKKLNDHLLDVLPQMVKSLQNRPNAATVRFVVTQLNECYVKAHLGDILHSSRAERGDGL